MQVTRSVTGTVRGPEESITGVLVRDTIARGRLSDPRRGRAPHAGRPDGVAPGEQTAAAARCRGGARVSEHGHASGPSHTTGER